MNKYHISILAFVGVVIAFLFGAWFFRWNVMPVHTGEGPATAYMVDRITGEVFVLHRDEKYPVKLVR